MTFHSGIATENLNSSTVSQIALSVNGGVCSQGDSPRNAGLLKRCYVTRRPLCVLEGKPDCTVISQIPVNSNLVPRKQKDSVKYESEGP